MDDGKLTPVEMQATNSQRPSDDELENRRRYMNIPSENVEHVYEKVDSKGKCESPNQP